MASEYDLALQKLEDLTARYKREGGDPSRNEATTRLQLIDTLLFECLNWEKSDCISEEPHGGQYTDYTMHAPHRLLILEAKKEGIYFELPLGMSNRIYDIRYFEKNATDVYKAIKQAIEYCQSRGTPFGAVCNGHQLLAFLGSRTDGLPPVEGKTFVFDSLDTMKEHFLELWQCVSKPGVQAHHLAVMIQEGGATPPPEKLSKRVANYPGFKNRNDLQANLQILGDLLIEDVTKSIDEVEFLRQCYCESGALSQYAVVSKSILKTRYSSLFEQAVGGPDLKPIVDKSGVTQLDWADSLSRRPVLLLGDVGVGKSIFIQHFIRIEASDVMADAIVFYVDFGAQPTLVSDLQEYLGKELARQLREKYGVDIEENAFVRGVYHGELIRFSKSIYGSMRDSNPTDYMKKEIEFLGQKLGEFETHLLASLDHIAKARRKQIIIFLDNIDQRPYEFQQQVFLIGQSMSESWPATVYISMRPETFYRSKASGTLSAYHPKAFTISPPRIDKVVEKRLGYAVSLLGSGNIPSLPGVKVELEALDIYLQIILSSFRENAQLMEFLDNICGGNVRIALDLIRIFVGSGHVDTKKIFGIYKDSGRYTIPVHEFLRAVIHGDYEHFDPGASEMLNIFDISAADGREHFLIAIVLAQLDRWCQSTASESYVSDTTVFEFCQDLGYQPAQIGIAINRALAKKLIERHSKSEQVRVAKPSHYRITPVGAYYYKKLAGMFSYVCTAPGFLDSF